MLTELRLLCTLAPWLTTAVALGYGLGLLTTLLFNSGRQDH